MGLLGRSSDLAGPTATSLFTAAHAVEWASQHGSVQGNSAGSPRAQSCMECKHCILSLGCKRPSNVEPDSKRMQGPLLAVASYSGNTGWGKIQLVGKQDRKESTIPSILTSDPNQLHRPWGTKWMGEYNCSMASHSQPVTVKEHLTGGWTAGPQKEMRGTLIH